MPSDRVLPVVLSELENTSPENITLINAVGTHRHNTPEELESMLGRRIIDNFRVVQHRPKDRESMVRLGVSRFGNEVWVNRDFMQAKIKILTGFIEPHFFAGFSGGPKSVLLGVGAFESILRNHSAPMIDNPMSTWGVTAENPDPSGDVRDGRIGEARLHRERDLEQETPDHRSLCWRLA